MFMGIILIVFGVCVLVTKFYEISKSVWISRHQTHQPNCPQAKVHKLNNFIPLVTTLFPGNIQCFPLKKKCFKKKLKFMNYF